MCGTTEAAWPAWPSARSGCLRRGRQHRGESRIVFNVCNERGRSIFQSNVVRPVQLPEILEAEKFMQCLECLRLSALAGTVVHHDNAWLQPLHQCARSGCGQAMMRRQIQV